MTTKTEVRQDTDGTFWLWEITESEVPGEGGARRLGKVTIVSATKNELDLRQQIETTKAQLQNLEEQLQITLSVKTQLESTS